MQRHKAGGVVTIPQSADADSPLYTRGPLLLLQPAGAGGILVFSAGESLQRDPGEKHMVIPAVQQADHRLFLF